ncbi:DUF736 family protein [Bradyrhizobium sp. 45]|uniref:DUF736 family protein n=1 Tax=Bradyrhizobium sp. 45 TaxID=1043587 RepID=UPI001FF8C483
MEPSAAWKKCRKSGRSYLSVRLDDPTFASPIFAIWSKVKPTSMRSSGRAAALMEPCPPRLQQPRRSY